MIYQSPKQACPWRSTAAANRYGFWVLFNGHAAERNVVLYAYDPLKIINLLIKVRWSFSCLPALACVFYPKVMRNFIDSDLIGNGLLR